MYFFNIGSNITALREFTALCKVDLIPLKKYLLGTHLKSSKEGSRPQKVKKSGVHEELVEEMGGVSALGKVSGSIVPSLLVASTHLCGLPL